MDRTNAWQRFWHVTLPMLKPTLFTVLTLGLIGTWQVFDQIYTGNLGRAREDDPDARLPVVQRRLQPAGLGRGRRDRVHLFAIIVFFILQRWVLRDRDKVKRTKTCDPRLQHAAVEAER